MTAHKWATMAKTVPNQRSLAALLYWLILCSAPTLGLAQDTCGLLIESAHYLSQAGQYAQSYDTSKAFVAHCASTDHAFTIFGIIGGDVQFISGDNMRWLEFCEWLKSVLYFDTLSAYDAQQYYCANADDILETFEYLTPSGKDYTGEAAVIDYLLSSGKCPDSRGDLIRERNTLRDYQVTIWNDSVHDPQLTPLDTTEPTIDSLGLAILRAQRPELV